MPATPLKSSLQFHRINTNTKQSSSFHQTTTTTDQAALSLSSRGATPIPDSMARYHAHTVGPNQCCSTVIQTISAPVSNVWSVVRRFDNPQAYKHFVKSCHLILGDADHVGSVREVRVISGLPAASSTERLEILDDERHVLSFSVVGGDHRLMNYRSVTTLHPSSSGTGTVVVESYVVDIPAGNTKDETCVFVDTIVRCNLQSLAEIAEKFGGGRNRSTPPSIIHRM